MANYTTNVAVNFLVPGQFYTAGPSSVISVDPMTLRVKAPNGYIQNYFGSFGFTTVGPYMYLSWPKSTILNVATYSATGALLESYSGMSIPGGVYQSYAQANNSIGLNTYIFRGNDVITGSNFRDVLCGYAGKDILNGRAGADTLIGGTGNDTYIVDSAGDVTTETSTLLTEIDTVQSSVSRALGANLERLILTGAAVINGTGNALNNTLIGNAAANTLIGGVGDDTLNGGAGNDMLIGGVGNDVYIVDNPSDIVIENPGKGVDTIRADKTFSMAAMPDVENLTLIGTWRINGTGNALDNVITGNAMDNILDGGIGNDTLIGGNGFDTYIVDSLLDVIIENPGMGIDVIRTNLTYSLAALPNVERLVLTGAAAINGTGNDLVNVITGNSADNILDGGVGADMMWGGLGNDTYIVDNPSDSVSDASDPGGGVDTVLSSVSYNLEFASVFIENLTLTGGAAINGTGDYYDNTLIGNDANNILDGGMGADVLTGNLGNDTFVLSTQWTFLSGVKPDTVTDFSLGDSLQLSKNFGSFAGLLGTNGNGTGNLAAGEFVVGAGAVANAANAQILYDTTTGTLSFDSDGTGVAAAVVFAQLTGVPALATTDFILV